MLQNNDINAELGFAASEDAALDALFEKAEKEIISSQKNLIGNCANFLTKLCRNFGLMQKVIALISLSLSHSFRSLFLAPTLMMSCKNIIISFCYHMVAFPDNACLVVEISNYVVKEKYKFQISSELWSDIEEEIIDQSSSMFPFRLNNLTVQ